METKKTTQKRLGPDVDGRGEVLEPGSLDVHVEVVRLLNLAGHRAFLEYPGYVAVGGWAFGHSGNETWGGNVDTEAPKSAGEVVAFDALPADSTDAAAIVAAILGVLSAGGDNAARKKT